jgi:addiction module HigA family antidote
LEDLTMHNPAHPGEVLLDLYLKPLGVSITAAADALGVTRKHVSEIVNGRAPVSADTAIRLAGALGTEAEIWVNMQGQYDLWEAMQKAPPKVKVLSAA